MRFDFGTDATLPHCRNSVTFQTAPLPKHATGCATSQRKSILILVSVELGAPCSRYSGDQAATPAIAFEQFIPVLFE